MDRESTLPQLIKHFESLNEILDLSFIEFIFIIDGNISSFYNNSFDEKFQHILSNNIEEFNDIIKKEENKEQRIKLKSEEGKDIICSIYPILKQNSVTGYIVTQSNSPIDANKSKILSFFSKLISSLEEKYRDNDINKKHKENLISARNVQAKLYPNFKGVDGLDIASVFLPVEIMSGDFVDAFFIDENVYQIVTCDITGFDASSSFAGASKRHKHRFLNTLFNIIKKGCHSQKGIFGI